MTLVVILTVRKVALEKFRTFEKRAAAVMVRYGGAIERTVVITPQSAEDLLKEIHIVTFPDERLHDALAKMLNNNIGRLPVVSRRDPHRLVGYLERSNVLAARLSRLEEEHLRESGWPAHSP